VPDLKTGSKRCDAEHRDADDPTINTDGHARGWDWKEVIVGGKKHRLYRPKCKCRWRDTVFYSSISHCKEAFYHKHAKLLNKGSLFDAYTI
jgi:hypothetical protein